MKNYAKLVVTMVVLAVAGSGSLLAQDTIEAGPNKPQRVKGSIEKLDDKSITVKGEKASTTVEINGKTKYGTKVAPKKAEDFKVGDEVLAIVMKDDKGAKYAATISPPAPAKPANAKSDKKDGEKKEEKK